MIYALFVINFFKKLRKENPLRLLNWIVVGSFVIIVIVLIVIICAKYLIIPDSTGYYSGLKPTIVVTNSMEPTIQVNGIISVEYIDFDSIELNDIISFYNSDLHYPVVHRVIAIGEGYVITKGDNNQSADSFKVSPDVLKGRVVSINNNCSKILSLIFGRFDLSNIPKSLGRIFIGFVILALILSGLIIIIYYICGRFFKINL